MPDNVSDNRILHLLVLLVVVSIPVVAIAGLGPGVAIATPESADVPTTPSSNNDQPILAETGVIEEQTIAATENEIELDELTVTRAVETGSVAPGETVTVSVKVETSRPATFTIVEEFKAFDEVALLDTDGAELSGVADTNDEIVATYTDREEATLTFEVTIAEGATTGNSHAFTGTVDLSGDSVPIDGDDQIDVAEPVAPEDVTAIRTIEDESIEPGETGTVSVEVEVSQSTTFTIIEEFHAFEEVALVDTDGAELSGVADTKDEIVATYRDREAATLTFEVTVPEDAADGQHYAFSGEIDLTGERASIGGNDGFSVTVVSDAPTDSDDETTDAGEDSEMTGDETESTSDDSGPIEEIVDDQLPGFGPVITILALLTIGGILSRR